MHRPSGARPELRERIQQLQIPAGSIVVVAARHLAAGHLTVTQLELLSRYESRGLTRLTLEHHVERGFLQTADNRVFEPSAAFANVSRLALDVQAESAEALWAGRGDLAALAAVARDIAATAARNAQVPTPAYDSEADVHSVTPPSAAGQLLAYVTELRYLRGDLHAAALDRQGLAGPRARALHRLWRGVAISDEDAARLAERDLAELVDGTWILTDEGRRRREQAEVETNELTSAAFAAIDDRSIGSFVDALERLPGDDPRPAEDR